MNSENPTNSDFKPYYVREFELYSLWKRMPVHMVGCYLGEEFRGLEGIRTQGDFAKRFCVSKDTLTNWNAVIERQGIMKPKTGKLEGKLASNLLASLYMKAMKSGRTKDFKLWSEIVEGWKPNKT